MNPEYQQLRQQADRIFVHFNDVCRDKSAVGGLADNCRNVVEDIEMNKNPHSIEDRIKRVIQGLKDLRHDGSGPMDFGHVDALVGNYEDLREQVRKLSNY